MKHHYYFVLYLKVFGPCLQCPLFQTNTTRTQSSLKDLCPEDKRRIANLIEELARQDF